jgi:16S rRNA (cytosine967-C5)-methyltransferase
VADARLKAIETLLELERRHVTAKQLWQGPRPGAETALVLGVLRRRGTLDAILKTYSSRRLPLLKPPTLAALRVGLFELLYLDDTPSHAVVSSAVESTRALGRHDDLSFVNALLRSIVRGSRRVDPQEATDLRRTLPREHLSILFSKSVFPDRGNNPEGFLAARGSSALWISRRRLAELQFDRALRCLDLQARTPLTHLRPAPDRVEEVQSALRAAEISFAEGPVPWLLSVPSQVRAEAILGACGGNVVFQDAVAAQVAPFVDPPAGASVLDYCAAPGGKATHLAQIAKGGTVTAWDIDEDRLALVKENAERLGLANLLCAEPEGTYAAVLVDAPCSNTGVLARRPEARWRLKERHIPGLAQRQLRILKDASAFVEPGGTLVYSTCSLEPEENSGVVTCCGGYDLGSTSQEGTMVRSLPVLLLFALVAACDKGKTLPPPPAPQPKVEESAPSIKTPIGVPKELGAKVAEAWPQIEEQGKIFVVKFNEASAARASGDLAKMDEAVQAAQQAYIKATEGWNEIYYSVDDLPEEEAERCRRFLRRWNKQVDGWTKQAKALKEFSRAK